MSSSSSILLQILPYIIPILIIEIILAIVALLDLVKQTVTRGPKWMWVLIIIFIQIIGPILYFFLGRKEE
jgi:heme/copper-type cytochrome/quinol oxidase subunit 4